MNLIPSPTIFIIEDDPLMAECIARAATKVLSSQTKPKTKPQVKPHTTPEPQSEAQEPRPNVQIFADIIAANEALSETLPDLIFLDVLLSGPDGFTFLNEILSYPDTAQIPVIVVTSLHLAERNLAHYGIHAVLSKDTMTPADIQNVVRSALSQPAPLITSRPEAQNAR